MSDLVQTITMRDLDRTWALSQNMANTWLPYPSWCEAGSGPCEVTYLLCLGLLSSEMSATRPALESSGGLDELLHINLETGACSVW